MKRIVSIAFQVIVCLQIFSQQILFENKMNGRAYESYSLINDSTRDVTIFLVERDSIRVMFFDNEFKLINETQLSRPKGEYRNLLGGALVENIYQIFFTNDSKNMLFALSFDPSTQRVAWTMPSSILSDELFLETVTYANQFYLISVKKKSSILKIYRFNKDLEYEYWNVDFSTYDFADTHYSKLSDVLRTSKSALTTTSNTFRIDDKCPATIELSAKENKVFVRDKKLIMLLDNETANTKILTIGLDDFNPEVKLFDQGTIDCGSSTLIKSNSFLCNDILLQTKLCSEAMVISIRRYPSGDLIREYKVTKDEEITFKNSALIQENTGSSVWDFIPDERVLKTTKQMLRKIAGENVGISAYKTSHGYEITTGGFVEVNNNNSVMMPAGVGFNTSYGNLTLRHYNPALYSFNNYKTSKANFFKTLIDSTSLEHIPGELSPNGFDQIQKFMKEIENEILSETIFRYKDFYVYGYFNKKDKTYYLRKFMD